MYWPPGHNLSSFSFEYHSHTVMLMLLITYTEGPLQHLKLLQLKRCLNFLNLATKSKIRMFSMSEYIFLLSHTFMHLCIT